MSVTIGGVHDYVLQVRGPVGPADGDSDGELFEWRLLDAKSREAVLAGSAGTWDLALQEGLARSRQDFNVEPGPAAALLPGGDDTAQQSEQMDLVRALLPHTGELPSIPRCAAELLAGALVEGAADAGAVLLRDGDVWRVAAGSGLRPLEFRFELTDADWLVRTVFEAGHGVVVNDTDVARQRLAGAPLASRRCLMAVPLTSVDGLLLLARHGDPPFEDNDLKRVIKGGPEAAADLAEAIEVHLLARTLARYA